MNRDEYNKLFHTVGLNRVALKAVNDCDDEILTLVNAAVAAEREACANVAAWILKMPENDVSTAIRARGGS